jgi:hypothetical protein
MDAAHTTPQFCTHFSAWRRGARILAVGALLVGVAGAHAAPPVPPAPAEAATATTRVLVDGGRGAEVADLRGVSLDRAQSSRAEQPVDGAAPARRGLRQHSTTCIGEGDFRLDAQVILDGTERRSVGIAFDGGALLLDDPEAAVVLVGPLFGGGRLPLEAARPRSATPGAPISVVVERMNGKLRVEINGDTMGEIGLDGIALGRIGFELGDGAMRVTMARAEGDLSECPRPVAVFSGADGAIDEYRDPAAASDGTTTLVAAIAVETRDDGSERTRVALRTVRSDGTLVAESLGNPSWLEVPAPDGANSTDAFAPDLVALGHDGTAWQLVVQELTANRLTRTLRHFTSKDGRAFTEAARIELAQPMRIMPGAMLPTVSAGAATATTALHLGATQLEGDGPDATVRAVRLVLKRAPDGGPTECEALPIGVAPACDPVLVDATRAIVRTPRSLARALVDSARATPEANFTVTPMTRYESNLLVGAPLRAEADALAVAQPDPIFPNPLRELVSRDGGATWIRGALLWGGPSGNGCSLATSGAPAAGRLIAFEGGDAGAREHVLVLRTATPRPQ